MKILRSTTSRIVALALVVGGSVFAVSTAHASRTHVDFGVSLGVPINHGRGHIGISVGGHGHGRHYGYRHGGHYHRHHHSPYIYRGRHHYHGGFYRTLPRFHSRVYVGDMLYYRANDIYYRPFDDGYVVVDAPYTTTTRVIERRVAVPAQQTVVVDSNQEIGAPTTGTAASSAPATPYPDQFQIVWHGDVQYQYDNGQFFKKTADGLVWSEPPYGAVCKQLPPDAKSVWYQDNEFWSVDGVYFRKTPDGYRVVQQPWANVAPAPTGVKQ